MVVNKNKDIGFSLQLIKNDGTSDTSATVSYVIVDNDQLEVVSSQSAIYNSTTESYVDTLDISTNWATQDIGTYVIIWSITATDFPKIISEDLQITIDPEDIERILGMVHENMEISDTVYDSYGNLTSAIMKIYSTSASVGTINNILAKYQISATGGDIATGKFTTWSQIKI